MPSLFRAKAESLVSSYISQFTWINLFVEIPWCHFIADRGEEHLTWCIGASACCAQRFVSLSSRERGIFAVFFLFSISISSSGLCQSSSHSHGASGAHAKAVWRRASRLCHRSQQSRSLIVEAEAATSCCWVLLKSSRYLWGQIATCPSLHHRYLGMAGQR